MKFHPNVDGHSESREGRSSDSTKNESPDLAFHTQGLGLEGKAEEDALQAVLETVCNDYLRKIRTLIADGELTVAGQLIHRLQEINPNCSLPSDWLKLIKQEGTR